MPVDLSTTYLGLPLTNPLVASSSPLTGTLDGLRRLEDAGVAAVVLPSLFEEQIVHESLEVDRVLHTGADSHPEASGYFAELDDYNTGPDAYIQFVAEAKDALGVPVVASLNGTSRGGWVHHARLLQEAGADALELNVYFIATEVATTSTMVELQYLDLIDAMRGELSIPLAVKLAPYFNAFAHMADLIVRAGASGLVLFNRFYQPDIDVETGEVIPSLSLSTSEELRLPLRWIAILYRRVAASLAATGGVHTSIDALKAIAAGADVAMMASALLKNGPEHIERLRAGIEEWLEVHEYESVAQLRGSMSQRAVADPTGFERSNYMKTLTTFTSSFRA